MEYKQIALQDAELKFATEGGATTFSGYASVFGGEDAYGDTIHPGAYTKTVGSGAEVKMYFNHGWRREELPVGKMVLEQNAKGLYVKRAEFTQGIAMADNVALAVKHGTVNGLSIGYKIKADKAQLKSSGHGRDIYEIDFLKEVSVVDWPADGAAVINEIKSAIEKASTIREIEAVLRDSGDFTRTNAATLVSRMKSVLQGELAAEEKAKREIAALFQSLV